ncbi:MAG: DUF1559 domain-containing protein [Candidatus Nealsonbacteria bacterium]|nr:DUF1559 domain-containing protein [Candidatus Nealsonbacteria bacterium]
MDASFLAMGISPLLIMLGLSGGAGLPLGVPPAEEDALLAHVAPEECLFYTAWSGMAEPDPASTNQTEQLLAEPDVQATIGEIKQQIIAAIRKAAGEEGPDNVKLADDAIGAVEQLLTRPTAVFLTDVDITNPERPDVRGGAVIGLGKEEAAKLSAMLATYQKAFLPPAAVQPVQVGGSTFHQIRLDPKAPTITWGMKGRYLLIGIGEGSIEGIVQRAMAGKTPAWLVELREQLPVERMSTVSYINLGAAIERFAPMGGPEVVKALGALGLTNVTSLSSVTGLDGEGFVSRTLLGFNGEPSGVLSFAGAKPLSAADLEPIPADATIALAARLDTIAVLDTILSVAGSIEPSAREEVESGLAEMKRETGIDLRTDILEPLGDAWCIYNSPGEGGLVFTGLTAVIQVDDPEKLAATNRQLVMLAKAQMSQNPSNRTPRIVEFKFAGKDVYFFDARDNDFPLAPSWCLTEKHLIVAPFPQNIKSYLSRGPAEESITAVPQVAQSLTGGEGPLAMAYMDVPALFELVYPLVPMFLQMGLGELQREGIDVTIGPLPPASAIAKHLRPGVTEVRRNKAGVELISRQTLPGGSIGSTAPVAVSLLLPAIQSAREAARRVQSANNMKQITVAMHNHLVAHDSFPAAYSTDKDGKPLLSWRVKILPYVGEQALYEQFHLDEPWDSAHNKKLAQTMPQVYQSPNSMGDKGVTNYLTVRGKDTAFPGAEKVSAAHLRDGMSTTIMLVEANDSIAVPWTKPDDFEIDEKRPMAGLIGMRPGGFNAAMCDGAVHFIPSYIDGDTLKAFFTRNGGEEVDMGEIYGGPRRGSTKSTTVRSVPREDATSPAEHSHDDDGHAHELDEKELERLEAIEEGSRR